MDIRESFDASAARYDLVRRQLIPCFDEFYRSAVEVISSPESATLEVLDLGAGTGLLARRVADAYPHARLTLVDLSSEMLAQARDRFSGHEARFFTLDYAREPIPGRYDLVVSALSIHHLEDIAKVELFERIRASLLPGGMFVNADQVRGPTEAVDRFYVETWLRRVREAGIIDADLAQARERMSHDRLATLDAQLGWLREAGFVEVDCCYKWYNFAVCSARTPTSPEAEPTQRASS